MATSLPGNDWPVELDSYHGILTMKPHIPRNMGLYNKTQCFLEWGPYKHGEVYPLTTGTALAGPPGLTDN